MSARAEAASGAAGRVAAAGGSPRRHVAGEAVLHPASLSAILALILNDHWWKAAYPGVVTGKISDFAGLAFFPLLLQGAFELGRSALGRPWRPSRGALLAAVLATFVGFAAVKLWAPAAGAYRLGLGALQWPFLALSKLAHGEALPPLRRVVLARDPTDLVALPALLVALWVGLGRVRRAEARPPEQG